MVILRASALIEDGQVVLNTFWERGSSDLSNDSVKYLPLLKDSEYSIDSFELFCTIIDRMKHWLPKKNAKLDLVEDNEKFFLRIRLSSPCVRYFWSDLRVSLDSLQRWYRRRIGICSTNTELSSGVFTLVVGRYSDKFIHEWITHPLESGFNVSGSAEAVRMKPVYYSFDNNRLDSIHLKSSYCRLVPNDFLYIRYVSEGYFSEIDRNIVVHIKESFLKKDNLLQSVRPFTAVISLDSLNSSFSGVLPGKSGYISGFNCKKNGEYVFGRIKGGYAVFKNIQINSEAFYG